jgi:iron complex transport system ATP-binding protein
MTELRASHLTVSRGNRIILNDVTLRANSGEFIAVIGANGAGKSTLLSAMAGLLAADSGTVQLNGKELSAHRGAELARRRAYLPQNPRCEWPISVERLVALGLTPTLPAFGGWSEADQARIDRALSQFDLLDHREQPATTLSGGELARAMLARAFIGDPDVLIADEPITGLDPRHALDSMKRLKSLAQSGKLVVSSLHDLTLAGRYASRIVALVDGQIENDGAPENVLTAALIRKVFGIEAVVLNGPGGLCVDFVPIGADKT